MHPDEARRRVRERIRQHVEKDQDVRTEGKKKSQAEQLLELAEQAELFRSPEDVAFATIGVSEGTEETLAVKSRAFRSWLARLYYQATSKAPSAQAMQDALGVLEARARFDGQTRPVFHRLGVGSDGGVGTFLALDLCDEKWRSVKITPEGWTIETAPSVRFRRAKGMLALPEPVRGGSIEDLKPYINVRKE